MEIWPTQPSKPPRHAIKNEHYSEFINSLGNIFIFGSDFNAKNQYWDPGLTTPKSWELHRTIKEKKLEISHLQKRSPDNRQHNNC
jgi:hypothetical protein